MNLALAAFGALAGLGFGSFIATAALRRARSEPFIAGRSHCDGCGATLSFAQTAPVVSFVWLRGACDSCGAAIDPLHPAGEVAGALAVGLPFLLLPPAQAALLAALGLALLASSFVDLTTKTLPDALTVAIAVLGLTLAWTEDPTALWPGLAVAAVTGAVLEITRRLFLRFKGKPGLGFGDVKLIWALALWLGLATPAAVALAAGLGLCAFALARPRNERMPFGPFIGVAAWTLGLEQMVLKWPSLA